jgi:retinol dehydrogenase 12
LTQKAHAFISPFLPSFSRKSGFEPLRVMSEKRIGIFSQLFPPKPTWNTVDVPDQAGKVVIITGGSGGIGQETARVSAPFLVAFVYWLRSDHLKVLLSKGARVYIAARSEEKSQKAIDELKKETGKESVFFLKLDLTDLVAVKAAAEEFRGRESELHGLYNNAWVPRVLSVAKYSKF